MSLQVVSEDLLKVIIMVYDLQAKLHVSKE